MSPRRNILATTYVGSSNVLPKCLGEMPRHVCDADAARHFLKKMKRLSLHILRVLQLSCQPEDNQIGPANQHRGTKGE